MVADCNNRPLNNALQVEHTRHRSGAGSFTNLFATIAAYSFHKNKPALFGVVVVKGCPM